ncbi:MAG TPA: hypothetical protein VFG99_07930, partial [Chloroflexia bacterium]|nr:hypothetical protein [Chloroflexia bacterium]
RHFSLPAALELMIHMTCREPELPYVPLLEQVTRDYENKRITFPPALQPENRMTDRIRRAAGGIPDEEREQS